MPTRSPFRSRPLTDFDKRFGADTIVAAVRDRLDTQQPVRVLEIGCGDGRALMDLRKLFPDIELYGINKEPTATMYHSDCMGTTALDFDIFTREELASVALPTVTFCDAKQLPFPDAHFDVVLSQVSIPYVDRKDQLVSEVWRTLKPGGAAFLHLDNAQPDAPDYLIGDAPRWIIYQNSDRVPLGDVFRELAEAGFDLTYTIKSIRSRSNVELQCHALVVRKNNSQALTFDLQYEPRSSFDLARLRQKPGDFSWLWGHRSVYRRG